MKEADLVRVERIQQAILPIRGQKVLLDRDLAALYGVETRALVQAVKRNRNRFPDDFMFQLTWDEAGHEDRFTVVFEALRQLMAPPPEPQKKRRIGFARDEPVPS